MLQSWLNQGLGCLQLLHSFLVKVGKEISQFTAAAFMIEVTSGIRWFTNATIMVEMKSGIGRFTSRGVLVKRIGA